MVILLPQTLWSQNQGHYSYIFDSLTAQLQRTPKEKYSSVLLQIADLLYDTLPDQGFIYAMKAFKAAAKNNDARGKGQAFFYFARYLELHRKYVTATEYCIYAMKLFMISGDKEGLMNIYLKLGTINLMIKRDSAAMNFFQKGLDIARKTSNFKMEGTFLNNIACVFQQWGQFASANDYYKEAEIYYKRIPDTTGQIDVYVKIGGILLDQKRFHEAHLFYLKLLERHSNINGSLKGAIYTRIAHACSKSGNYLESLKWNKKAYEVRLKASLIEVVNSSMINIAGDFFDLELPDSGWFYLEKGLILAHKYNRINLIENSYHILSNYYQRIGNDEKALEYYRKLAKMKDQSFLNSSVTDFTILEDHQNIRNINLNSQMLLQYNKIQLLNLKNQRFQLIFLEAFTGLTIFIFLAFLVQFMKNRKAKNFIERANKLLLRKVQERKQAQDQAENREKIYQIITDNSLDFIINLDKKLKSIFASHAARQVYGYEPNEILNKSWSDFMHPDFRESSDHFLKRYHKEKSQ